MTRRISLLAGGAVLALALTWTLSAARPAAPGPGAVLHMHERLFAALDRGDVERVRSFLAPSVRGATWDGEGGWEAPRGFLAYLPDADGQGVAAENEREGVEQLMAWSREAASQKGAGWKTEITRAWSDCRSADLSFAMLEFERTRPSQDGLERERYRSTSLVSHKKGGWVAWHIHISPQD